MAHTDRRVVGRSMKPRVAVPVPNAIQSRAPVNSDRGEGNASKTELEDWLAAKRALDLQLKKL